MSLRLPPLPALRLFEAAGRHMSFKQAAAELNVTPSAVSHGILSLEQALGTQLFVRERRGLALTSAGADYLKYVSEALSLIATGTQRLPGRGAERTIAVSCAPVFASRWLLPRLQSFSRRWPRASVTVDTSRHPVGFPTDGFDFAIRMSRTQQGPDGWTRLLGQQLVPVCSPAYRNTLVDDTGCIDLRRATLIHVIAASEDWQSWLTAKGLADIDVTGGLRFDTIELAFAAAVAGFGVVLGRRPFVDRELEAGSLVEVGAEWIAPETAYWLVSSGAADRRPVLRGFKRWLIEETQAR